ncbi:hypothetical protein N0V90_010909 [Kalmusia sp. IMI 367209]|nr:hypothetical protein N0V90_010909 [Kalmusia sp. IMI 367209]
MQLTIYAFTIALSSILARIASHPHFPQTPTISFVEQRDTQPIVPNHHDFPLRVLPLGASITYGQGSTDGIGYRDFVRGLLQQRDTVVDMVGTVRAGLMKDNQCEGYPGARVDQVTAFSAHAIRYQPNLILINAASNDAILDSPTFPVDKVGERMDRLLDTLFEKIPDTTIVLSTLLINTHNGVDPRIRKIVNPQYQAIVKRRQDNKQRIVLADMYPAIDAKDLVDGTHPNDNG